jgi:hypothetical protein
MQAMMTIEEGDQIRVIHGPSTVKRATLMVIETPGQPLKYVLQHYDTIVLEVVGKEIMLEKIHVSRSTARAIEQVKRFIFEEGIEKAWQ